MHWRWHVRLNPRIAISCVRALSTLAKHGYKIPIRRHTPFFLNHASWADESYQNPGCRSPTFPLSSEKNLFPVRCIATLMFVSLRWSLLMTQSWFRLGAIEAFDRHLPRPSSLSTARFPPRQIPFHTRYRMPSLLVLNPSWYPLCSSGTNKTSLTSVTAARHRWLKFVILFFSLKWSRL